MPIGFSGAPARPSRDGDPKKGPAPSLGLLPLARRDVDRLMQIVGLQRRLTDMTLSPRARRALMHRGPFQEALTWLELHGQAPETLEHWRGFIEAAGVLEPMAEGVGTGTPQPRRRRRRRRRPARPTTT